jgi:hypothetical protein
MRALVQMTPRFRRIVDHRDRGSLAARMRRKRLELFSCLLHELPRPVEILDIGGTASFWEATGFADMLGVHIVLLNLDEQEISREGFSSLVADATNLLPFEDGQFDVVFSNSVIEHISNYGQQKLMAQEIQRVGRRYFVQTPNRAFPIEPHFVFPGFHWLPVPVRAFLVRHLDLGWYERMLDPDQARELVESIRLLGRDELLTLFPGACLWEEKVFPWVKSLTAYSGW